MACATRAAFVSSRFASAIHSQYSRRWPGENFSKAAFACLFFASAEASSFGTFASGLRFDFTRFTVMPASFNAIAALM